MNHFDEKAALKAVRELERKKWFIASKQEKEEKRAKQEQALDDFVDLATGAILLDVVEIEAYKLELETYDIATIEAITENNEILEELYLERERLLNNAHILENGRRVFKTQDGKRVFDEQGNPISEDVVHPDEVPNHTTTYEELQSIADQIDKHKAIADGLAGYQLKLDEARERLDSGKLTQDEFDEIKDDLEQTMPIEVRHKLPGYDSSKELNAKPEISTNAPAPTLSSTDMTIDPALVPGMS
ncbi:MAG: hypothetical protein JJ891_06605 [Rhizobiaceae bacterium]|nr:hypothetical protein [Rhizobiaceae bacterium]